MSTLHTAGSFSGASDKPKIALDIVRLKKLPQSEDEALPCSASVRLSCLLLRDFKVETETQKGTNNPYYNYSTDVALPENYAAMDKITFIIEVVEHARKPTPQTILYGNVVIPLVKADPGKPEGKVELSVFLTAANPGSSPEEAAAQEAAAQKLQQDVPTATLRYKIHIPKPKKEAVDPHADVVIDSFRSFPQRGVQDYFNEYHRSGSTGSHSLCLVAASSTTVKVNSTQKTTTTTSVYLRRLC